MPSIFVLAIDGTFAGAAVVFLRSEPMLAAVGGAIHFQSAHLGRLGPHINLSIPDDMFVCGGGDLVA
jgi:hypothetical protein